MTGLGLQRPLVVQQFQTFSFAVGASPLPIAPNVDKTRLITSFMISNPLGGSSVFMGNAGVTTTTGIEILAGTTPVFIVDQGGRQLYELQSLLLDITQRVDCKPLKFEGIPFVTWDMSAIFLVAAAPITVSVALFPAMYI